MAVLGGGAVLLSTAMAAAPPGSGASTYAPDFVTVMANPERGFFENFVGFDYLYPQRFDGDYAAELTDPDYASWRFGGGYLDLLRSYREDGVTLLDAHIYLDDFIDAPELPEAFVDELPKALRVVREAGMKIVLRAVYADAWTPMVVEENYLRHVEQIGEVVTENADIVAALCAGVLGPWGEWHNDEDHVMVDGTSHERAARPEYQNHAPTTDLASPEQGAQRYRLVEHWLDNTPDTVPVLIRYTEYLMELKALADDPPAGAAALTPARLDRLGLHDDSFASYVMSHTRGGGWEQPFHPYWDDRQVYDPVEDVAGFATRLETSYGGDVLQTGEPEWYPADESDLDITDPSLDTRLVDAGARLTLEQVVARKMTSMNRSYNTRHLQFWKDTMFPASGGDPAESVYDRLDRRLGYRLRVETAEFTTDVGRGDSFDITVTVVNDGYAGIVRPRPLFLVFDNGTNRYDVELSAVDVRTWRSGTHQLKAAVVLPVDMEAGHYTVALWLPDQDEDLRDLPEYSVRFANPDVWNESQGYNRLGVIEHHAAGGSESWRLGGTGWLLGLAGLVLAGGGWLVFAGVRSLRARRPQRP
jgi:hypothetical protein